MAQLEGRLSRSVAQARDQAIGLLAQIEAVIDFPDDVDELSANRVQAVVGEVRRIVRDLLATADTGLLARVGATVAIVGRPNVGKSSLLNALVQAERAIVTAQPGTTRDVVETAFQIEGIPLTVLDTAGIRESADEVEALGVARSRQHLAAADVRLLVVDASAGLLPEDLRLLEAVADMPTVYVANKADLLGDRSSTPDDWRPAGTPAPPGTPGHLSWELVSATTGQGVPGLEKAILRHLRLSEGPSQTAVNARHRAALQVAAEALDRAYHASAQELPLDCVSADVRMAVLSLGQVLGTDVTEEMLDVLFSRFCVGK